MKTRIWILTCLTLMTLLFSCSNQDSAGGTMETENSIAIRVRDSSGHVQAGASAQIRPVWYLGDTSSRNINSSSDSLAYSTGVRNVVTDKEGWIVCDNLPAGMYRMEVSSNAMGVATEFEHWDTTTARNLGNVYLQATGIMQGFIALPKGVKSAWVQLYGSEFKVRTDSSGFFEMKNIPAGLARVVALSASAPSLLAEALTQVRSNRITQMGQVAIPSIYNEDPLTWRYSSRIRVDTLIHDWMLPISDTTMLTIRLEAPVFDFTQAMSDGRDLRINDDLGRPLRFERVRWDATKGKAIIRVAKTAPFDSNTFLTLRWGHAGAVELDTSGLWKGVPDSVHQYLTQLLLGDFEKGSSRTDLPTFLETTWWYNRTSDSLTTMSPAPFTDMSPAFQDATPRPGKAAHFTYSAANSSHWVLMGMAFANPPQSLATMDSLVFYAKGNGSVSVAFDNLTDSGTKAWMHISLDTNWTRYLVRPSDLLPANMATEIRDWETVQDSVTNLTFLINSGNDFWLDSVMIYGVGVEDIYRP